MMLDDLMCNTHCCSSASVYMGSTHQNMSQGLLYCSVSRTVSVTEVPLDSISLWAFSLSILNLPSKRYWIKPISLLDALFLIISV